MMYLEGGLIGYVDKVSCGGMLIVLCDSEVRGVRGEEWRAMSEVKNICFPPEHDHG